MHDSTRPCAHCGAEFVKSGKPYSTASTYCPPCAREYRTWHRAGRADAWHATRVVKCHCGAHLPQWCSKYCSEGCRGRQRAEPTTGTCALPACHNLWVSSFHQTAWCSDSCKQVGKKLKAGRSTFMHPHWLMSPSILGPTLAECGVMSAPVLGPSLADWPLLGPRTPTAMTRKICQSCGVAFVGGTAKRFCSDRCFRNPIDDINPESCLVEFATCPDAGCGKPYAFDTRMFRPSGCCTEHTKRIARRRRRRADRARKRNQMHEPYTLREIAERDGWRCHLCGGKVPDRQYAARDKDATIDHLIPQSHGGDDIKSNVALAHNRCNWERGNQGLAQLRLVG